MKLVRIKCCYILCHL